MKLNNGVVIRDDYFTKFQKEIVGEDIEDVIEYVYGLYDETVECYRMSYRACGYTKIMYLNTFLRLYEDIGGEVFELSLNTYARCVTALNEDVDHHFTKEEIEEFNLSRTWDVFKYRYNL